MPLITTKLENKALLISSVFSTFISGYGKLCYKRLHHIKDFLVLSSVCISCLFMPRASVNRNIINSSCLKADCKECICKAIWCIKFAEFSVLYQIIFLQFHFKLIYQSLQIMQQPECMILQDTSQEIILGVEMYQLSNILVIFLFPLTVPFCKQDYSDQKSSDLFL